MTQVSQQRIKGDYGFEARNVLGHVVIAGSSAEMGGHSSGARSKQRLSMALGNCNGINVISILKRLHQHSDDMQITVQGTRVPGVTPFLWQDLYGIIDPARARACARFITKYCSIAETLRKPGGTITWEVTVTHSNTLEP